MKILISVLLVAFLYGCGSTTVITHSEKDSTSTSYTHDFVPIAPKVDTLVIFAKDTVINNDTLTIYVVKTDTAFVYRNKIIYKKDRDSIDILIAQVTHWRLISDSKVETIGLSFFQKILINLGYVFVGEIILLTIFLLVKGIKIF